jgi:hypothetical protein
VAALTRVPTPAGQLPAAVNHPKNGPDVEVGSAHCPVAGQLGRAARHVEPSTPVYDPSDENLAGAQTHEDAGRVPVIVFISSVRRGPEEERDALPGLILALGHEARRFEDLTAQAIPSREVCLRGVENADVLLLGPHYGEPVFT